MHEGSTAHLVRISSRAPPAHLLEDEVVGADGAVEQQRRQEHVQEKVRGRHAQPVRHGVAQVRHVHRRVAQLQQRACAHVVGNLYMHISSCLLTAPQLMACTRKVSAAVLSGGP